MKTQTRDSFLDQGDKTTPTRMQWNNHLGVNNLQPHSTPEHNTGEDNEIRTALVFSEASQLPSRKDFSGNVNGHWVCFLWVLRARLSHSCSAAKLSLPRPALKPSGTATATRKAGGTQLWERKQNGNTSNKSHVLLPWDREQMKQFWGRRGRVLGLD